VIPKGLVDRSWYWAQNPPAVPTNGVLCHYVVNAFCPKKIGPGPNQALCTTAFAIMPSNENKREPLLPQPLRTCVYDSRDAKETIEKGPTPYVGSTQELVERAVADLIRHGWHWEPTDPGRWGLFPGYGRADRRAA
jgi:hypothetical protein